MSGRKNSRALSGAVTALILVIASVIIALVVVGFAFGLFGAFASSPNIHLVSAYIQGGVLYVTVSNTGSASGEILGVIVQAGGGATSLPPTAASGTTGTITVSAGSTVVLSVSIPTSSTGISALTPGEQVTFELVTNTGAQVSGVATVLS
ncbi:hypothetical protein V6M85_05675 [Sulfolobus tengchongensis]|uniref:DUF4352 domain-containing protein n=1 Tax=Sulfolobus tengchongensis TaxID=207809 RepID=A0AAX4L332_9CREN